MNLSYKNINSIKLKLIASRISVSVLVISFLISGCKKFVDVPAPTKSITDDNVYTSDYTAIAVLTGMYTKMGYSGGGDPFTGTFGISLMSGLSADEFTLYSGVLNLPHTAYYRNALNATTNGGFGSEFWNPLYNYIYSTNAAIEGLNASFSLTPAVKKQLLGEAKFLRAFYYFYLVNYFGDVPLTTTTDYKINSTLSRIPQADVYQQIITDLKDAQELLSISYLDESLLKSTAEKVRPTKWAATALLARVYLYIKDYANAEIQAGVTINSGSFSLTALNNTFLKNSSEAIWQLQPIGYGRNTEDGWTFIIPPTGLSEPNGDQGNPVSLSNQLLNSFESNDQRSIDGNWVNSVDVNGTTFKYPFKYKSANLGDPVTEYFMVFRLGEQYLIRAEARAELNKITEAQSDVNAIRIRAGLSNTIANDKPSLLTAILHERQVELFSEWGHRWFDLKRTNNIDAVMTVVTPLKANGAPWKSYQQWHPLSFNELNSDPNLTQNSGY